jgi:hypothetical protein
MVKIPTAIAEQGLDTQRSTQPRIQVETSQFGALGRVAEGASDTLDFFAERYRKQQDQLEQYNTERSFQEFQNNVLLDSIQYEQEAEPGAPNFYKTWADRYEEQRKKWESTVPPRLLPEYQIKTEGYKGQVGSQIARKEVDIRNQYYTDTLNNDVDGLSATAFNNPDLYDSVWETISDRVNMSGLSGAQKQERLLVYKEKLDEATVAGLTQQKRFDEARDFISPLAEPQGTEPNILNDENWNLKNYERWEFGDTNFEINTPVARAMDLLTNTTQRKPAFTAKKDSVKVRIDNLPDFEKNNLVLNAKASGFSSFAFSKGTKGKGEYVTLRVDDEGVSNRPEWLNPQTLVTLKSYSKAAGNNSRYLPIRTNNARKLIKLIDDEEDRKRKEDEDALKQVQTDIAKEGWKLHRDEQLTTEWLDANEDGLAEEDYRMLTKAIMRKNNGTDKKKDKPYETDQTEYVDLIRRAINPDDKTVISDAIAAQTRGEISKTDFNQIFDTYRKSTEDGTLGKPAGWKKEMRQYIIDKIRPAEEGDTGYLDKRMSALFEFDDYLKENPDVTRDVARKTAEAILEKNIGDSNQSRRDTLSVGSYLGVGRYAVTRDAVRAAAAKLKADKENGIIANDAFNEQVQILAEWNRLIDEEEKNQ